MISYPVSKEDYAKLSTLLANELMATNNSSYIQSVLADPEICHLSMWDYVKSSKANPQILRKIVNSTNHDVILSCIAGNEVTTEEVLADICSNPEKYYGWMSSLSNPKARKEHAMMMIGLRQDDSIFSGASAVAYSRFLDEEIAERLFSEFSLKDFDFSILKKSYKRENKKIIDGYKVKLNVISTLLSNEKIPTKWLDVYLPIAEEQNKYDSGNSLLYAIKKNKIYCAST